jgi:hypothetical protein
MEQFSIYLKDGDNQALALDSDMYYQELTCTVRFLGDKKQNRDEVSFDIKEIGHFRYSYPNYIFVKGQREIISYDFKTKHYTYFIAPAPIVLYTKDNRNTS